MKIAIPVYGDTVSNVFDFAHRILLVDVDNGREINRCEVDVGNRSLPQRAGQLKTMGVDVLICGAISQLLSTMVTASGIEVLPYVTGTIEDVLNAYLDRQLVRQEFRMPGLRSGHRQRQGCRWRGGHH